MLFSQSLIDPSRGQLIGILTGGFIPIAIMMFVYGKILFVLIKQKRRDPSWKHRKDNAKETPTSRVQVNPNSTSVDTETNTPLRGEEESDHHQVEVEEVEGQNLQPISRTIVGETFVSYICRASAPSNNPSKYYQSILIT
jgi:hypothetical protein